MHPNDKDILKLVVSNAVLEAFNRHERERLHPLEEKLDAVVADMSFVRRSARGAWAVFLLMLAYFGIK
jgi:hypothetical protein